MRRQGIAPQVPLAPAVQLNGQAGHFGPTVLPLSWRKRARSPALISAVASSRSKIAHGRVPLVPQTFYLQALCALVVGLVAGLVPAYRAARVKIVDGLRHIG